MKLSLEPNSNAEQEAVPFHVRVDFMSTTIDIGSIYYVPVQLRYRGVSKTFVVDLCGFEITSPRPEALLGKINGFLPRLVALSRLPTYMFIARRARSIYPVYTFGNEVFATTRGGPVFRHVELAKVREYLTDYLHDTGVLGELGLSDKLHVRGVNMNTLGLRRPVFYLKKRVPNETDFWAPVFEEGDGKHIYAYAASKRREVPIIAGSEVLALHGIVADALKQDRRLTDNFDLRPDRLFPEYWDRLKETLTEIDPIQVSGFEMATYQNGNLVITVEKRPDEGRYGLFLGHDIDDLRKRVIVDFERRGIQKTSKQRLKLKR